MRHPAGDWYTHPDGQEHPEPPATATLPDEHEATTVIVRKPGRVDCPAEAYADLVAEFPQARTLVDQLLGNIASRVANIAQVLAMNSGTWEELAAENGGKDAETMIALRERAAALAWVRDELGVLTGSGLGRAAQIPAFSNPAVWCDQVAPDPEDEP